MKGGNDGWVANAFLYISAAAQLVTAGTAGTGECERYAAVQWLYVCVCGATILPCHARIKAGNACI
jgi:hypothetical protein